MQLSDRDSSLSSLTDGLEPVERWVEGVPV